MYCFRYIFPLLLVFSIVCFAQTNKVIVINVNSAIHPASADYIHSGLEKAKKENAECLIIKLNTPGGLLNSTREIVTDILESEIPVIVYVSPSGSRAASAGVFITMAANIAAMAPGTNIGAAHPVSLQGQMDSVMIEKATNDAAAFIRTISEKRNRNIQWAEDAVRKSLSITETEAIKLNVIDIIAKNVDELLENVDGKEVEIKSGKKTLHTKNAEVLLLEKNFSQELLGILSDPNIAYILMMLGIYGLLFELYSPGAIFPGVIGGICLILAFYSMNTLPVNYAGLALIILSIILFILEIKVVSHGVLTIGGVISLFLGSVMLINTNSLLEAVHIDMGLIIFIVAITAAFFLFVITLGIKAQRKKVTTGIEGLIGEEGTAVGKLNPYGKVYLHGEYWNAESTSGEINRGDKISVIDVHNLQLKVKKIN